MKRLGRGALQHGFSLIEVLVAMALAAITLLGLAVVQARSLSYQVDTESRRTATMMISQFRELVSANQQGYGQALADAAGYSQALDADQAVTVPACANANACNPTTEVPAILVAQWFLELQRQLPAAVAQLAPEVAGTSQAMRVSVGWLEPNANAVSPDGACAAIESVADNPSYRCVTIVLFPG